ncbi:MAG: DUF2934 domain-containing protein, partial [Bryobacteraceae bacterium]
MGHLSHDRKPKISPAADSEQISQPAPSIQSPAHEEIAARAHELWLEQGQPPGSAESNWLEA